MKLDDRMKRYEAVPKTYLSRRTPVIIRIDGKAFHTVARHAIKPFDPHLSELMHRTSQKLLSSIQGCKMIYSQSDEISLLLIDYDTLETEAWFDYNVQKLASISASIATAWFNTEAYEMEKKGWTCNLRLPAMFDARAFNVPREDVNNYFVWRQQDAERNSIQALAQAHYSQKQMQNISCRQLATMLEEEKKVIWGNLRNTQKRGFIVGYSVDLREESMPIFSQNKNVVEQHVYPPDPQQWMKDLDESAEESSNILFHSGNY